MWCFWLIVAGIFFVFEIITVGFLIFWLGIGAIVAMITSFFTDSIAIQTGVFVITSAILIPLTKPLADKYINKKTVPTNTDLVINKHGIVTADIDSVNGTGLVKINGEIWSAKCDENIRITQGSEIEVLRIDGVKLVVSPIKQTSNI